ncbi:TPA: type II toxin-antitoxin system PemK/MazF family toxin [Clostridium botulinum]
MLKNNKIFIIRRGDIFDVDLGKPKGTNQGGIRPCIVVANNKCNESSTSIHIVPITSKLNKRKLPTHIFIKRDLMNGLDEDSLILAEQTSLISTTLQILEYRGKASDEIMEKIDEKIKLQFAVEDKPAKRFNERRVLSRANSLKELEIYIDKQKEKPADLLNILKSQVIDFRDYCDEYNIDCSKYYVSKFNIINKYLQRNIAA